MNWKKIYTVLKWVIGIGFLLATYFKFKDKHVSLEGFELFESFSISSWICFGFAMLLSWLNWNLERIKWQLLIKPVFQLSNFNGWKSVLAGLAVSSLMPNRTAEYGGRILFLPKSKRIEAVPRSMEGGTAQLSVTLLIGAIMFLKRAIVEFDVFSALFGCALLFFSFLLIGALKRICGLVARAFKKYTWSSVFKQYATEKSANYRSVWLLSLIRYLVFTTQYVLLICAFGSDLSVLNLYGMVAIIFLYQSFIPVPAMFDLGVRVIISSSLMYGNELELGMAAFSIWIINLVIPSIIGLVFFYASKSVDDDLVVD